MTIRILVTGSREWDDRETLGKALSDAFWSQPHDGDVVFIHGDCHTGADRMVSEWCELGVCGVRVDHEPHPADWSIGKAAGPIRNQRMADLGADLCLAFPTSKSVGTWDCIKRANRAGIPVRIVPARVLR